MTLSSSDFWSNQRCETCSHPSGKGPGPLLGSIQYTLASLCTWKQAPHQLYPQTKREFPPEFLKADNPRRRKKKGKDQEEKGVEGTTGKESKRWKETPSPALGNDPGSDAGQCLSSHTLRFLSQALNCGPHALGQRAQ